MLFFEWMQSFPAKDMHNLKSQISIKIPSPKTPKWIDTIYYTLYPIYARDNDKSTTAAVGLTIKPQVFLCAYFCVIQL